MRCLDDNVVNDFVEGRLTPEKVASLEHHIGECDNCLRLLGAVMRAPANDASSAAERAASKRGTLPDDVPVKEGEQRPYAMAVGAGCRLEKYLLHAPIGRGGMGIVYVAEHTLLRRRVALKVMRPELTQDAKAMARFFLEAKAVNAIANEHVVEVTDFGASDGVAFLVMELLVGESLAARLAREGAFGLQRALHIIFQIVDGLAAAHARGITHRDLKPENIFLITRGGDLDYVKLLDFGLAKLADSAPRDDLAKLGDSGAEDGRVTATGVPIGTPAYMSPEQWIGAREIDHRTDIYSLGIVMFEMLTGRVPFTGENFYEIAKQHLEGPFPSLLKARPDLSPKLEKVLLRAVAKRDQRYPTIDELGAALKDFAVTESKVVVQGDGFAEEPTMPAAARMPRPPLEAPSGPTEVFEAYRTPSRVARIVGQVLLVALLLFLGGLLARKRFSPAVQPVLPVASPSNDAAPVAPAAVRVTRPDAAAAAEARAAPPVEQAASTPALADAGVAARADPPMREPAGKRSKPLTRPRRTPAASPTEAAPPARTTPPATAPNGPLEEWR